MRIIKFRGLNKQGKWIYGMPTYDFKYIFNSEQTDSPDNYEVNPETVTEFTGLQDKKGKEIYEGDILRGLKKYGLYGELNEHFLYIAIFGKSTGTMSFGLAFIERPDKINLFNCPENYEIIGNKFEHLELLNQ